MATTSAPGRARHRAVPTKPSKPPVGTRRWIIGLDGARGLSCLGVAVMHIGGHYSPVSASHTKLGLVGLSLIFFYVLSGFLLFLPYVRNLAADRATAALPDTRNFAIHRLARILPGYLAIFLICNYVLGVVYVQNAAMQPTGTDIGTGRITDPGQLIANLTLVQSYFPQYFQTGLNPSWSLTLEFAFYLSLPLLGMLLFALRRRIPVGPLRLALLAPAILLAVGFVGKLCLPLLMSHFGITNPTLVEWGPNWFAVFLRSFLASADNFAFGMLAAVLIVAIERGAVAERIGRRIRRYSLIALLPIALVTAVLLGQGPVAKLFGVSGVAALSTLVLLIIVAPLACGERSAVALLLETAPFRFVGKVSLSAYLWHFPVMLMLGRLGLMAGDTIGGMLRNIVLGLAVTLLVSLVTYHLVEEPTVKWARRYRYRTRSA